MVKHFKYIEYKSDKNGNIYGVNNSIIKGTIQKTGYRYFTASYYNMHGSYIRKQVSFHRFIVECHIGPIPKGMEVNHIDGNKLNNALYNLEVCTSSYNQLHAFRNGLQISKKGEDVPWSTLTDDTARNIIRAIMALKSNTDIAKEFNTDVSVVSEIRHMRNWKHLFQEDEFNSYIPIKASASKAGITNLPTELRMKIIKDLFETSLTNREIRNKYNIQYKHLEAVRKEKIWNKEISMYKESL